MAGDTQSMDTLVLINSRSPLYAEGRELVLPTLDHLGLPGVVVDLAAAPLPSDLDRFALIVAAHGQAVPPDGAEQRALAAAVQGGCGLMSFDPNLLAEASAEDQGQETEAETEEIAFARSHAITAQRAAGESLPLAGPLHVPPLAAEAGEVLLSAGDRPLLAVSKLGQGRVARWATPCWLHTPVLGPLAGLDDVLWRSLAWAARKPFALRGLPPLVTMRVDDVAGWGGLWKQSPLYWVHAAAEHGFRPWLGLFIYNLAPPAIAELRDLVQSGRATAFPHALGRPRRTADDAWYYDGDALPLRSDDYDEFIYYDHHHERPWPDEEAARGLAAVDAWYAAHAPLPISPYAIPHWYEMGSNVMAHMYDCWNVEFVGRVQDEDAPLTLDTPWLQSGPFRRYEEPGTCFNRPARRGDRPVYYADFVELGGHRFFNCVTEIRDDAGYEWAPDNDVQATIGRGVRQLRRALDSFCLPVLFTHETDFIYLIRPEAWAEEVAGVAAGIAGYDPVYVTLDEGVRTVRATRTSRFAACRYDAATGTVAATFTGHGDVPTCFYAFVEAGDEIAAVAVKVPAFSDEAIVRREIREERAKRL